jgi:hypothetical protein
MTTLWEMRILVGEDMAAQLWRIAELDTLIALEEEHSDVPEAKEMFRRWRSERRDLLQATGQSPSRK